MLRGPLESDTCRDYVRPRLEAAGRARDQIVEQFPITDGRLIISGRRPRRGDALWADYVLEYRPGVAVAVVEAKREYRNAGDGMQQAKRYAQMLDLPFAYSSNGKGIVEDDRDTGEERMVTAFPSPEQLWQRYRAWKGILAEPLSDGVLLPFNRSVRTPDGGVKEPRYYQRVAINRAVTAILRGDKRLLLTLATGTGKTFVSLQIVWKLWSGGWDVGRKPRILTLADRNILVDQPIQREYVPAFGQGPIWKLRGEPKRAVRSTSLCTRRSPTPARIPTACSGSSPLISSTSSSSTSAIVAARRPPRRGEASCNTSNRRLSSA